MRIVGGVFGAVGTVLGVALLGSGAVAAPAWTGLYVGGHVGINAASDPFTFEDGSTWKDGFGFFNGEAGGFIGFNQQVGPHWVVGVEADASWLGLSNIEYDDTPNAFVHWMASIDARAGYLVSPATLLYGKLGWGVINFDMPPSSNLFPGGYGADSLSAIQAGVGMETDVGAGLKARVEAIYTRAIEAYSNTDGVYSLTTHPDNLSARVGLAYAFGDKAATRDPDAMPAADWSGLYFGGQAGWAISDTREEYLAGPYSGAAWNGFGASAANAGAFVGINKQINSSAVVGIELGGSWLGLNNSEGSGPALEWGSVGWMAALDARAGFLVSPKTLLYGKAGGALLDFKSNYPDFLTDTREFHQVLSAIQVGVGLEAQMSSHWSARVEGLYTVALKGFEFDTDPATQNHSFRPQIVSGAVGVAYKY